MTCFNDLNDDVLISIFCFFNPVELLKLSRVCKQWNNVINNCSLLWKIHSPLNQDFTLPHMSDPKELVKFLYKESVKLGGEYWYQDPYQPLVQRDNLLRDLLLKYTPSAYNEAGFKLYARLNTTYDIVRGCKYKKRESREDLYNKANEVEPCTEFLAFVKSLWKTFNRDHPWNTFVRDLETEVDVWKHSYLIGARHFLYSLQSVTLRVQHEQCCTLRSQSECRGLDMVLDFLAEIDLKIREIVDPDYLYDNGIKRGRKMKVTDVLKNYPLVETEEGKAIFGYLDGIEDFYVQDGESETETTEEEEDLEMDEDLSTSEVSITSWLYEWLSEKIKKIFPSKQPPGKEESFEKYAKRHYKPVPLSLYKDMMNIMFGSSGRGLVRVFNLSEGCFNENLDLGFYLYVGENAALYEIVYYEL